MSPPWNEDSFEDLFRQTAPRVRAYVARHIEQHAVDDVVAETYCVAWRKLARVPAEPLAWLIGTSRNCLRRQWRSRQQSDQLWLAAVREQWREASPVTPEDGVLNRDEALRAFASLTDIEREALLLTAWDGLSATDAALVAGCSPHTFTVRLGRARASFDKAVQGSSPPRPTAPVLTPPPLNTLERSHV